MGRKHNFEDSPEYKRYIQSPKWKAKRAERLEYDHNLCVVCGKEATEVHHLDYDHFEEERLDEIVSLCHSCHQKAEEIADSSVIPWAMDDIKPEGNNFMAAMRVDARRVAPVVFDYLVKCRGAGVEAILQYRQPTGKVERKYWGTLKDAVNALCGKRYYYTCVADRREMMLETVCNHVATISVICITEIEHGARNEMQASLYDALHGLYDAGMNWKQISELWGLKYNTVLKMKDDDGTSFGPSLRETILYYCGLDAAAGIEPSESFQSLITPEDYCELKDFADYMSAVSGSGNFKGEYAI